MLTKEIMTLKGFEGKEVYKINQVKITTHNFKKTVIIVLTEKVFYLSTYASYLSGKITEFAWS